VVVVVVDTNGVQVEVVVVALVGKTTSQLLRVKHTLL
jgi:hypothetical protein